MTRVIVVFLALAIAAVGAAADPLPLLDYHAGSWFLPQSPSVTAGPAAGLFNPGAFALTDRAGTDMWRDSRDRLMSFSRFGFATGRTLNLAMNRSLVDWQGGRAAINDWQVGLAGGTRAGALGLAYRWSGGAPAAALRDRALVLGLVSRPARWLTWGASRAQSLEADAAQNVFDLGLRPAAAPWLTLFGDFTVDDGVNFGSGLWGAGVEVRPLRGVHVGVRAREHIGGNDPDLAVLLGFSGRTGHLAAQTLFDPDGNDVMTTWLARSAPPFPGRDVASLFGPDATYLALDLQKRTLTYQKHRWLDDDHVAWLDLLAQLEAVRDDPHLDIVVLNLAGFGGRPSLLWEMRQQLQRVRDAGKRVVVYLDRAGLATMYLATVADRVVLDPQGDLALPGLALSRSFLKGTLDKLGLGFQEHRYFRYKSAVEMLSRDSMSDADREQRQRVVDVAYETWRDGIASGRRRQPTALDAVVDSLGFLTPQEALDAGLVDELGRWDQLLETLRKDGARPGHWPASLRREYWDQQWGSPARIPVVFLVGDCAMDSGINGRRSAAWLRDLVGDPSVKAVVLRADSPGGDPLPSDLVADAVRALKAAGKPVVVSQGDVAASGGYWISMDGTRILTTPVTITGSIGVISGWLWDDGLAAKAGITAESVQRGRHADLYTEIGVPMLGGLPRRPMNDDELARTEQVIRGMYDQFVAAVARGRGLEPAAVHEVAQGRVWMGQDAIDRGLCDSIGGLADAIAEARSLAGLRPGDAVDVFEYPPRPLVRLPQIGPRLGAFAGLGAPGALLDAAAAALRSAVRPGGKPGVAVTAGAGDAMAGQDPLAADSAWLRAAGLGDLEATWLAPFGREPGRPRLVVHPDELPQGWRVMD
ncbi:MAG: S49 family peptidase [bacterium]|nr:S49 family peptidase [bacterium]